MASVAGTAVLVIGLATGAASVADLLLSEGQKKSLANLSLRAWYYIEVAKGRSLLAWLNRNKIKKYLLLVAMLLVAFFIIWSSVKRDLNSSLVSTFTLLLFIVVPNCFFGLIAFNGILRAATPLGSLLKASLWLFVFLIPFASVIEFANLYRQMLVPVTLHVTLTQLLFVIAFVSTVLSTVILAIFWTVAALPVALTYLAIVVLTVAEFFARRIAESSKGPLLALAAFATLAGAWLRFF